MVPVGAPSPSSVHHNSSAAASADGMAVDDDGGELTAHLTAATAATTTLPTMTFVAVKRCAWCFTSDTPQWRRCRETQEELCNSCGLKASRQQRRARQQHNASIADPMQ